MNARTPPGSLTLIVMTGLSVVSLSLFLPALPKMATAFGVDYAVVSIAVSGYLAATAVVMLAAGPLTDRYGRRPIALVSVGVFTLAALGAAYAPTVELFLLFRLFQATLPAVWVVVLAAIRDVSGPGEATARLATVSAAMALAPMLGPMAGGALEGAFGWRSTLHALWIVGALTFVLIAVDFGETRKTRAAGRLRDDAASLLSSAAFWPAALCLAFSSAFFHVFSTGAPHIGAIRLGMSPAEVGVWMAATPFGFFAGSLITRRIARALTSPHLMILGRLIACAGLALGLALILAGWETAPAIFGAAVFGGLGNGLTIPGANDHAMAAGGDAAASAAGLTGAMAVTISALASQATALALSEGGGSATLLTICLACAAIGLAAAAIARQVNQRRLPRSP